MVRAAEPRNRAAWGVLLLRLLVGWVFLSEGIQKFLLPAALGVGRFTKIGIPASKVVGPLVGVTEILCGALLIVGFYTSIAVVPLLVDIAVAIETTKVSLILKSGFWVATHEARVDFCMVIGLIGIPLLGSGSLSLDARRQRAK